MSLRSTLKGWTEISIFKNCQTDFFFILCLLWKLCLVPLAYGHLLYMHTYAHALLRKFKPHKEINNGLFDWILFITINITKSLHYVIQNDIFQALEALIWFNAEVQIPTYSYHVNMITKIKWQIILTGGYATKLIDRLSHLYWVCHLSLTQIFVCKCLCFYLFVCMTCTQIASC